MGLSIHYSGSINDELLIFPLIEEASDICKSMGWQYHIWQQKEFAPVENEKDFTPEHLNGISISIEGSEVLCICFLPNKKMSCLVNLLTKNAHTEPGMIYWVSVKTQFGGPDVHIAIVKVLRYISNKYLSDFEMNDEGMYWETNDEQILLKQFERYNFILDEFTNALSGMDAIPGESPMSLVERIEKVFEDIHKKLNP